MATLSTSIMLNAICCAHVAMATKLQTPPSTLFGRRAAIHTAGSLVLGTQLNLQQAGAEEPALETYKDKEFGDTFLVPSGWPASVNELSGGRKLVAFADPADANSNVFVLWTPLAADYTSLGSFGNIDSVATTFLPACGGDRGTCSLSKDGIEGRLIESATVRGSYVYDYVIDQVSQPTRHLRTLVSIALEEGRGKRLVTLTAQSTEAKHASFDPTFKKVIDSYKGS